MSIDAQAFLELARPALLSGDALRLAKTVTDHWSAKQVATLLSDAHVDVRQTAAVALGLIGDRSVACILARALHDDDDQVIKMAEHGLWTIWLRDGTPEAHPPFQSGLTHMQNHQYHDAIDLFAQARQLDPDFAEAAHQSAQAHYMIEAWEPAIRNCRHAVKRMPCHFEAMACMGHCYAQLNDLRRACKCYQAATAIHPHLPGITRALKQLTQCLGNASDNSGQFDALPTV